VFTGVHGVVNVNTCSVAPPGSAFWIED